MNLIIFPNNLYEKTYLPQNISRVFLIEDPIFFGYRETKMKFNKLKLVLHRSSMKYYYNYLTKKKIRVTYIELKQLKNLKYDFVKKEKLKNIFVFELNDHLLKERLPFEYKTLPNPNFLLSIELLQIYYKKKQSFYHQDFYKFVKTNILETKKQQITFAKSMDSENRKKIKKTQTLPTNYRAKDNKYKIEARIYVNEHFNKNYGNVKNTWFPVTHKEAKACLTHFINHKLKNFGTYQDAILQDNGFLYHSCISSSMNIGLLNPDYVLRKILEVTHKFKINNIEGFIRQILGWREYQRYCYLFCYNEMKNSNYFGNNKQLSSKWYSAKTKIRPVDDAIKFAFEYGYLHHIVRLMVICNFMNLCRIKTHECFKWFMEFSIDSYPVFMIQNVYSMGLYSDGGFTMRKPYLSSSNYILNLSDYKKTESWVFTWKCLFYYFLERKQKKIENTVYNRNLVYFKKLDVNEQKTRKKIAKTFLNNI